MINRLIHHYKNEDYASEYFNFTTHHTYQPQLPSFIREEKPYHSKYNTQASHHSKYQIILPTITSNTQTLIQKNTNHKNHKSQQNSPTNSPNKQKTKNLVINHQSIQLTVKQKTENYKHTNVDEISKYINIKLNLEKEKKLNRMDTGTERLRKVKVNKKEPLSVINGRIDHNFIANGRIDHNFITTGRIDHNFIKKQRSKKTVHYLKVLDHVLNQHITPWENQLDQNEQQLIKKENQFLMFQSKKTCIKQMQEKENSKPETTK